jgi:hypothetical protein
MPFPEMALVAQKLHTQKREDVSAETALKGLQLEMSAKAGESVAVGVGSRGISQIPLIVHQCVTFLKKRGLKPFIVPAMGSHGGNTTNGELSVLASLGMSESSMGVPIDTAGEVLEIGRLDIGKIKHCLREPKVDPSSIEDMLKIVKKTVIGMHNDWRPGGGVGYAYRR